MIGGGDSRAQRVAHAIRTPLTSMRALSEVLRRRLSTEDVASHEILERIDVQIDALAEVAYDLTDASLLEDGGQIRLAMKHIDLVEVVTTAIDRSAKHAHRNRCAIELQRDVDQASTMGDAARLTEVVLHLLENALKFMPSGGVVRVFVGREGPDTVISVDDQGIGMDPNDLERAGEPYFRSKNAPSESFAGIGLGLWLSKSIIESHGGRMTVTSELALGTRVVLHLPERPQERE